MFLYFYQNNMQEIKLFGRYVIRPDNGKTWAVSDILTNKDKDSENFEKEYESNTHSQEQLGNEVSVLLFLISRIWQYKKQ